LARWVQYLLHRSERPIEQQEFTTMIRTFDAVARQAFALVAAFSVAALMIGAAVPVSPIA
jgi:hypothetical protein